jgi:zinc/manganese transport system ATP-binding protein
VAGASSPLPELAVHDFARPSAAVVGPEIVSASRLRVGYHGQTVWSDASFSIRRGEFVAVIGPNGAGKTTLFRLLLGLLRPQDGSLRVFDGSPRGGNPKIGYVPQTHSVDRDTNVEAVQLVRLSHSENRWVPPLAPGEHGWTARLRRAAAVAGSWAPPLTRQRRRAEAEATDRALRSVGALSLAHKPLGAMSGGELQRIFLAEALVTRPELLLLDEPLANLDIRRAYELVELVHSLVRSENVATLLVAHDINPLIRCLDKVIYVANGRVATGTPGEVLTTGFLTELYGVPVEVLRDSRGNLVIVGGEDAHPDPNL